jgi:transposase
MPWKKSEPMDQRREFALKALGTLNFRALCQEYGISAKTGYKWRERFLRQGLEGMGEESRRPRSSPKQLSEGQVCEMGLCCNFVVEAKVGLDDRKFSSLQRTDRE